MLARRGLSTGPTDSPQCSKRGEVYRGGGDPSFPRRGEGEGRPYGKAISSRTPVKGIRGEGRKNLNEGKEKRELSLSRGKGEKRSMKDLSHMRRPFQHNTRGEGGEKKEESMRKKARTFLRNLEMPKGSYCASRKRRGKFLTKEFPPSTSKDIKVPKCAETSLKFKKNLSEKVRPQRGGVRIFCSEGKSFQESKNSQRGSRALG